MRVSWEINDAHAGKSPPQYTEIDDDDLADCQTEEERDELIAQRIQSDFMRITGWYGYIRRIKGD
jgi:hypothetical protein